MLSGFIAGLLATALLVVAFLAAPGAGFNNIGDYISWELMAIVCGGIVVAGILLCGIAAWVATTRYLHQDYDELFK